MRVAISRIRSRILQRIRWPQSNREFVQTVSDISYGRDGWFPYGHLFVADEVGWIPGTDSLENESAASQRVRRALLQYERAEIQTTYRLFEWKRGGGKSKSITQYGRNFLNEAAIFIQNQLIEDSSAIPTLVKIDELVLEGTKLLCRKESRKLRTLTLRKRTKHSQASPRTPPQRDTQPTFENSNLVAQSAVTLVRRLGLRIAPTFAISQGHCICKSGKDCARPWQAPEDKRLAATCHSAGRSPLRLVQ